MKILVYGCGVIGSYTIHELCKTEHEITVVVRGKRKEKYETKGICIHASKKVYEDHPRIISEYDGAKYDLVFSIMQCQQQESILDTLAQIDADRFLLIGNNMTAKDMLEKMKSKGMDPQQVYFGFQESAGQRYEDYTEVVAFGAPAITLGHLSNDLDTYEKDFFLSVFKGSKMGLVFMDDMDAWYKCHAAFIIPIVDLAYAHHCNLRECTLKDIELYMEAGSEVYAIYQSLGIRIRPEGDEKNTKGIRKIAYILMMYLVAKTKFGELAITNHCRNAVGEMEFMEEKIDLIISQRPEMKVTAYKQLKENRPEWKELHETYDY